MPAPMAMGKCLLPSRIKAAAADRKTLTVLLGVPSFIFEAANIVAAMSESIVRLGCFLGVFALVASLESLFPRRHRQIGRPRRWLSNIGISFLNQAIARPIVPVSAIALATQAEQNGTGLLQIVAIPMVLQAIVAILLLDLAIYGQHALFHAVPFLWRFHQMHHTDTEFDVTTGIRFHPISILLSAIIKLVAVILIGPPAIAVLIFEVLLNATSMFNHSNLKIPAALDRVLRSVVVTPDMHRVHHSVMPAETNSNYGFNFPWWDRLFGTYNPRPAKGHEQMEIGLEYFRDRRELGLGRMLSQPFRKAAGRTPKAMA